MIIRNLLYSGWCNSATYFPLAVRRNKAQLFSHNYHGDNISHSYFTGRF
ncbi:hypothetical protein VK055_1975 [Klebsiella pneumoniae subsp. pneumoniae]|nr:hypothetical protein VK055_1975 [Klebsiella pneumoniae subsp. pneumoniae]